MELSCQNLSRLQEAKVERRLEDQEYLKNHPEIGTAIALISKVSWIISTYNETNIVDFATRTARGVFWENFRTCLGQEFWTKCLDWEGKGNGKAEMSVTSYFRKVCQCNIQIQIKVIRSAVAKSIYFMLGSFGWFTVEICWMNYSTRLRGAVPQPLF